MDDNDQTSTDITVSAVAVEFAKGAATSAALCVGTVVTLYACITVSAKIRDRIEARRAAKTQTTSN